VAVAVGEAAGQSQDAADDVITRTARGRVVVVTRSPELDATSSGCVVV
jgi:hypothetical protein